MLALANAVRAAGGAGDRERFHALWAPTHALAVSGRAPTLAPTSLLNLARGAASLGEIELARSAARDANTFAEAVGESKTPFQVESLLASLDSEERASGAVAATSTENDELTDAFVGELVDRLRLVGV